ncbi:YtxH domain-containing protein [Tunicatimonas pelagia]|uniref:YtxH domain-containing protein n=1 Tax=Tunicatimonas pelagia TaxID=931531 RepID=UPI0026671763|nr:YtxH domain-containing protein [Tunicatimonas pelagia]WKN42703.1 YtxH domain-containing protein [Tunicatimonas pelagia]
MEISSIFTRKKKKAPAYLSLDALKDVSVVTGVILALNKAVKAKLNEQRYDLFRSRREEKKQQNALLIMAGLLGGIVAGAVAALLVAPQSGNEFRGRISGMFGNGHNEESAIEQASEKAEELAETAKQKAERAERNISDN